jgi:sec-independent protein translocase protein TatC
MQKTFKNIWRIISAPFRFIAWFIRSIIRWISRVVQEIKNFFTEEVEDAPVGDALNKAFDHPQDLFVHLNALRKHLFRALAFLVITTAISFTFNRKIIDLLSSPIGGINSLVAIEVTEPIGTVMRVALLSGFALAFPYIALEIWLFVAPGLSRRSRVYGLFAIPFATLFFVGGMAFAYYVMLPTALPFLLNFMGIQTIPRPSSYIKFTTGLLFWIGISFEFPLVIFLLAKIGLIKASVLMQQWRIAIVIIAVVSAVVTPTIDPVNMGLVMGPMILLYFFSVLLAKIAQPRVAMQVK